MMFSLGLPGIIKTRPYQLINCVVAKSVID